VADEKSLAINAQQLTKTYSARDAEPVEALRGVDLSIAAGEIYALLGPNGAGKTTMLSILTTLLKPTSGVARVAGFDVVAEASEVRRRIGVTFQEMVLDQELTGREVLDFHGRLYGQSKDERRKRILALSELVELSDAIDRRVSSFSGGMKRRLELARGLMTDPDVLFLDEPTQGLDPQNRAGIWTYIQDLRQETGLTLLLTTHYMEEAETLADRVGIIDGGRLVAEGEPRRLVSEMGADVITFCGLGPLDGFVEAVRQLPYVTQVVEHARHEAAENGPDTPERPADWCIQAGVDHGDQRLAQLVKLAGDHNTAITNVSVSRPTLADVFLARTGHAMRDS
jgi:ABC-2 type transport system ATP-binding protein